MTQSFLLSALRRLTHASFSCNKREVGWPKVAPVSTHGEAVRPPRPGLTSPPQLPVQRPSPGLRNTAHGNHACCPEPPPRAPTQHSPARRGPGGPHQRSRGRHVAGLSTPVSLASPAVSPAVNIYEGLVSAFSSAASSSDSWPPGPRALLPAASIAGGWLARPPSPPVLLCRF